MNIVDQQTFRDAMSCMGAAVNIITTDGPAGRAERLQVGHQFLLQRGLADHGEQGAVMRVHLRAPRRSVARPAPGTAVCR